MMMCCPGYAALHNFLDTGDAEFICALQQKRGQAARRKGMQ